MVLARPFARALALAATGALLLAHGWPLAPLGAAALVAAAILAVRAAWSWERTRIVVTADRLVVAHGTLRRRTVAVALGRLPAVEVEQTVLGRVLGYGTLIAGDVEVGYVPEPGRIRELIEPLSARSDEPAQPRPAGGGAARGARPRASSPRLPS